MSKKLLKESTIRRFGGLLKESTIRRFGGLAGIRPATTSNFLTEFGDPAYVREEEEEVVDDFELELPPEGVEDIGDVEFEDEEEIVVEKKSSLNQNLAVMPKDL